MGGGGVRMRRVVDRGSLLEFYFIFVDYLFYSILFWSCAGYWMDIRIVYYS